MLATVCLISGMTRSLSLFAESQAYHVYSLQTDTSSVSGGTMTSNSYANEASIGAPAIGSSEARIIAAYTHHAGYTPRTMQIEIYVEDGGAFMPNLVTDGGDDTRVTQNAFKSSSLMTLRQQSSVETIERLSSDLVPFQAQMKINRLNPNEVNVQLLGTAGSWQLQATHSLTEPNWYSVGSDARSISGGMEWYLNDLASLPSVFFRVVAMDPPSSSNPR